MFPQMPTMVRHLTKEKEMQSLLTHGTVLHQQLLHSHVETQAFAQDTVSVIRDSHLEKIQSLQVLSLREILSKREKMVHELAVPYSSHQPIAPTLASH